MVCWGWVAEWLARRSFNPRSCGLAGSNLDRRTVAHPSLPPVGSGAGGTTGASVTAVFVHLLVGCMNCIEINVHMGAKWLVVGAPKMPIIIIIIGMVY